MTPTPFCYGQTKVGLKEKVFVSCPAGLYRINQLLDPRLRGNDLFMRAMNEATPTGDEPCTVM